MISQVTCPDTALVLQAYKYENNSSISTQGDSLWHLQDIISVESYNRTEYMTIIMLHIRGQMAIPDDVSQVMHLVA